MDKTTVLITGVGGRSVGYQILSSLNKKKDKYKIVATDADSFSAGLFESDVSYLLPLATDPTYIDKLLEICKKESVKVILPGSTPETLVIANNAELLNENGIIPITNPKELIAATQNKISQYIRLMAYGFNVPRFLPVVGVIPTNLPFDFPLIVKPSKDHQGSKNVFIIKNRQELDEVVDQTMASNTEILLQEYVGTPDQEYTVGVVVDKEGKMADAVIMRRVLHGLSLLTERIINGERYAISTGYSQGVFVKHDEIRQYCIALATTIGATGPFNVQLRYTKKGVFVFEIHTRFSGSGSQRSAVGFNEPDILIDNFYFNQPLKITPYRENVAVIRRFENVIAPMTQLDLLEKGGEIHEKSVSNGSYGVYRETPDRTAKPRKGRSHRRRAFSQS